MVKLETLLALERADIIASYEQVKHQRELSH